MTHDIIRYHVSDPTSYLVMGVNLPERECWEVIHENMDNYASDWALIRQWSGDNYGIIVAGVSLDGPMWWYLVKPNGKPNPPIGFWQGVNNASL